MTDPIAELLCSLVAEPTEALQLDRRLAAARQPIDVQTRAEMWRTLDRVLRHRPDPLEPGSAVGLLLGRIQSGKTTAMTGMAALAHDMGYRLVVSILGSTNLLLDQNTARFLRALGIGQGLTSDYTWAHIDPVASGHLSREVDRYLGTGRTVLITVLKNSRRLQSLAEQLSHLDLEGIPCLVLDDEADQASLNTYVSRGLDSPTYRSIVALTSAMPSHLYVQVTATPFAPLLLEPADLLSPSFVEVLEPGVGYTGAREFFVDNGAEIVRFVPASEALVKAPQLLPTGLRESFSNFLVGAATLLAVDADGAPVSMLVHPTHLVGIHDRVALLLHRELKEIRAALEVANEISDLPEPIPSQLVDLLRTGAPEVDSTVLLESLRRVARLVHIWVVNSTADQNSINWAASPAHVLVGGNKLDRGFTVEGLTVSYLSRSTSPQADTLAQRARAFGYRNEYLPYCRFYASSTTIEAFRSSVLTEEAMRAELLDWLAAERPLCDWAQHVGFILGDGLTPTRALVAPWLDRTPNRGWHVLANPNLEPDAIASNHDLVERLGLLDAPKLPYGRLSFRTLRDVPIGEVIKFLVAWSMPMRSGWTRSDVVGFLSRVAQFQPDLTLDIALLDGIPDGIARVRRWIPSIGFSNLMQGRDNNFAGQAGQYAGDREMFGTRSGLQVHLLQARSGGPSGSLFTLAFNIGDDINAATEVRRA